MNIHDFAEKMMMLGKAASGNFAKNSTNFVPTFIVVRDGAMQPLPFPHFTEDRQFHIGLMRTILKGADAEAYAFIMEAWLSEKPLPPGPINPENWEPASKDPERQEALVVHCGTRDGDDIVLMAKIKRHGHK